VALLICNVKRILRSGKEKEKGRQSTTDSKRGNNERKAKKTNSLLGVNVWSCREEFDDLLVTLFTGDVERSLYV